MKTGYKNVIYDGFNKQILVRRVGETKYEKLPYNDFYYIETKEPSKYKDCFGRYMKRIDNTNKDTKDTLKRSNLHTAESNLKPEIKWLHEEYDSEELNYTSKDFRICFFDIEVQSGRKFPLSHHIRFRLKERQNNIEKQENIDTIRNFEDKYDTRLYDVYDEEKRTWRRYRGSCYFNTEFPFAEKALVPINLITCWSNIDKKTYTWGLEPYTDTENPIENYRWFEDELEMFKDFLTWFRKQNFDIWSGWNSDAYDIPYICNRLNRISAERHIDKDFTAALSPLNRKAIHIVRKDDETGKTLLETYEIPGLLTLDYMNMFKKFGPFSNLPSWKLDFVADKTIGRKKLQHEALSFEEFYRKDYNYYVLYNRRDAELLPAMDEHNHVMDMVISFAHDCLIPLGKVTSMIATATGYILKFIHNNGIVLTDKPSKKPNDWWYEEGLWKVKQADGNYQLQNVLFEKGNNTCIPYHVKGGHVAATPGRYSFVMSGDITSSYPHQVMMYNISPETKVIKPTKEQIESGEVIRSEINGIGFKRTSDAILPSAVKKVFSEKDYYSKLKNKALKEGDEEKAVIYDCLRTNKKQIANSMYGVCLNENFMLYDIDCARAITRGGRVCIRYIMEQTNRYYTHEQFLKDGMNEMPVINIRFNGEDHWLAKNEEIEVKDKSTGKIQRIKVKDVSKDMLINVESVKALKKEVK